MIYSTVKSPTGTKNINITSFNLRDIGEKSNTVPESKASLSVVIPVYNSEGIILDLHKKLTNELSLLVKNYELIFVNDSSPDNIWTKIQLLAKADPHVKAISLRRNFGYDSALMAGLNYVSYPYVVIMDDDLQHNPEDIPQLLSEIEKGYDVVYGNFPLKKQSFVKNLGSWFVGKLAQFIVNKPARLQITSYKIFRKEIAKGISQYGGPYPYIDGLIFQMTSRT